MRSQSEADADFADGNSDVILTDTYPQKYLSSKSYTVESSRAQTLGLIFNPENTTLQNDKLRQALAYGINRTEVASLLSEDLTVAYGIIPPAVNLLGRSYRELYADEQLALSYNPTEATALFEEVSEELGLNSMNTLKILVPSDITDTDALLSICQEWQNLFGYYIGIETVTQSEFDRRIAAGEYSIALYSISAGRNSCYAVLQEVAKNAALLGMESEDFGALMQGLSTSQQLSDSVTLYGAAEQAIMESRCFIPLFYKNTYLIYTSGNEALFYDAFARVVGFRDAKHFS
jgi:oligopeptide transport system substrate-binding protein